jgi:hypothetical protein
MSTPLAIGAVGALAGLAALGSRRGSTAHRRGLGRFGAVSERAHGLLDRQGLIDPTYLDDLAWNLDVVEQLYPRARYRYPRGVFDLRETSEAGGWFLPGTGTIRLSHHHESPGLVSHQSMHMLDNSEGVWSSGLGTKTPAGRLTLRALELAGPHLESYIEGRVQRRLDSLRPSVRRLLTQGGPVPWDEVHQILVDELGTTNGPEDIQVALESAQGPFGTNHAEVRSILWEDPALLAEMAKLSGMLPGGGVPFSLLGKPKAEQDAYYRSYDVARLHRGLKGYTRSRYEVFARLMDQVLREEALRRGMPIRRMARVREDDIPLDLLPEIEDQAWSTARQMEWTW